jgi:hypothetical protein
VRNGVGAGLCDYVLPVAIILASEDFQGPGVGGHVGSGLPIHVGRCPHRLFASGLHLLRPSHIVAHGCRRRLLLRLRELAVRIKTVRPGCGVEVE